MIGDVAPEQDQDPLIGKTLGPCRVESVLGRGGMGVVYRAFHVPLDRPVALKVLSPELAQVPGAVDLLLSEARTAARLEDPRIVRIYDVGQEQSLSYIIMQLIAGETLEARVLRQGPLAPKEALRVMKEVLLGLSSVHRAGIVHRDIKPANIILEPNGGVKIMDFGVAGTFQADPKLAGGSSQFMAPEQAFGWEPDVRADLYSLGVAYFYILTGRTPYSGKNSGEQAVQHRESAIPDVRQFNREVTSATALLISRLMAKSQEERPASTEEVLKALSAPGILLEVDPSGSPFKILPPPVEEKPGFVPPPAAERAPAPEEAATAIDLGPLPAPPPVPHRDILPTTTSRVIFVLIYLFFFGQGWLELSHADWAAGGLAAMAAAALVYGGDRRVFFNKAAGFLMILAMAFCFHQFGLRESAGRLSGGAPGLELTALLALSALVAAGSYYLGAIAPEPERGLAVGLLAAAALGFLISAAVMRLPADAPWIGGILSVAREQNALFIGSGGPWRWLGVILFYAGSWIFFPRKETRANAAKRIRNWNA